VAGVKRHVVDILRRIDLQRFSVTYYYSLVRSDASYQDEIAEIERRGITCHNISMEGGISPIRDFRSLLKLVQGLWRQRPEILHLHSSKAGGLGRIASLLLVPHPLVIYTPHAMACFRSRTYLWLERMLGKLTDMLVAVSASEKDDFIRWRIPNATLAEIMPLGLGNLQVAKKTLSSAGPLRPCTVGSSGRICFQKNALLFFRVAIKMVSRYSDYRFRWIGEFSDDDEAKAVRNLLKLAGNPARIEITGWVQNTQAQMEGLDIFCIFSRYESFGYVTAEAMLLGVPVLATPATGTIDLVRHEVTGLLAEPNEAALIGSILLLQADASLRSRLTVNARQFVTENHTLTKMVEVTEELYSRGTERPYSRCVSGMDVQEQVH